MSRILGDLTIRLSRSGATWSLAEPLEYHVGAEDSDTVVQVPAGFETDLASVPWFGRWLVSSWKGTARAAVVHDFLYSVVGRRLHGFTRAQADSIFGEALRVTGSKAWPVIWAAVRLFGRAAWRGREREAVEL